MITTIKTNIIYTFFFGIVIYYLNAVLVTLHKTLFLFNKFSSMLVLLLFLNIFVTLVSFFMQTILITIFDHLYELH